MKGHKKARLPKTKGMVWEKKGNFLSLVCYETNLTEVPSNTWWLDSIATIHVSNTM